MDEESAGTPHASLKVPSIEEDKNDNSTIVKKPQETKEVTKEEPDEDFDCYKTSLSPTVFNIITEKTEKEDTCESPMLPTENPDLSNSDANLKISS